MSKKKYRPKVQPDIQWLKEDDARRAVAADKAYEDKRRRLAALDAAYAKAFPNLVVRKVKAISAIQRINKGK